jgi:hypothetical protein
MMELLDVANRFSHSVGGWWRAVPGVRWRSDRGGLVMGERPPARSDFDRNAACRLEQDELRRELKQAFLVRVCA